GTRVARGAQADRAPVDEAGGPSGAAPGAHRDRGRAADQRTAGGDPTAQPEGDRVAVPGCRDVTGRGWPVVAGQPLLLLSWAGAGPTPRGARGASRAAVGEQWSPGHAAGLAFLPGIRRRSGLRRSRWSIMWRRGRIESWCSAGRGSGAGLPASAAGDLRGSRAADASCRAPMRLGAG